MDLSNAITFADAIDRLSVYAGGAALDKPTNKFRIAVQDAYRDLTMNHAWRYLLSHVRIQLEGPYTTGTVTYDSGTRVLTLTGGTWPTWAGSGRVRIADIVYRAEERTGATTLKLAAGQCPAASIADATAFVLYQSEYLLPLDFRGVWEFNGENRWGSDILSPQEWLASERVGDWSVTSPGLFTIMASTQPFANGRWALFVSGYPAEDETFDAIYLRQPRAIKYAGTETAAKGASGATISNTGAAVTGVGTAFSADMVGSLLRFTTSASENPTGKDGQNPYTEQVAIKAVASATSLTLESAPAANYSAKRFTITDPFEIAPTMHNALYAAVAAYVDRVLSDAKRAALSWPAYMREKQLAKESDAAIYLNAEAGRQGVYVQRWKPLGPDQT